MDFGGSPGQVFNYLVTNSVKSESSINSFPNYDNAYYKVSQSYVNDSSTIANIKTKLVDSPIAVSMITYREFVRDYTGGVYTVQDSTIYDTQRPFHTVTIVSYSEADSCWICKNSWGTNWGESGYFKIKYGQCRIDDPYSTMKYAAVNQSCLAKITPGFHSNLSTALAYTFETDENAYINSSCTLSSNASLQS